MTVELEAWFEPTEETLRVRYRAANGAATPVHLLNILWGHDPIGRPIADPLGLYVSLDDRRELRVGAFMHPLPKLRTVEQRIVPLARELAPGDSFEDALELALPVAEHTPYDAVEPHSTWEDVPSSTASFWLSWVAALEGLATKAGPVEGLALRHPALIPNIRTIHTAPVPLSVPVRRRVDVQERF